MTYGSSFNAEVWLYGGQASWFFVTVPSIISQEIDDHHHGHEKRGWGSLPVQVKIGTTIWKTSIFPDKEKGAYLLPLKKEVRKLEGIVQGSKVKINLKILN